MRRQVGAEMKGVQTSIDGRDEVKKGFISRRTLLSMQ